MNSRAAFEQLIRVMCAKLTLGECWEVLDAVGVSMHAYPAEMSFRERLYREAVKRAEVR
jgi:hypothetical protein